MQKILILDFGAQYSMLIARRVREMHVYSEIRRPEGLSPEEVREGGWQGIIFTGGPGSVNDPSSPHCDPGILDLGIPVLGICYGHQLIAWLTGGTVEKAEVSSEYGKTELYVQKSPLFAEVPQFSVCWMSHTDYVSAPAPGFRIIASTSSCPAAAVEHPEKKIYGVQFHPEVSHTEYGSTMLRNFIYGICGCTGDWQIEDFLESSIARYREQLKGKKALLALSGGVDSTVAAVLMHKAIGEDLTCIFVDHGLLRKDEGDTVERMLKDSFDMKILRVNAGERFLSRLAGVTEPEKKRKIIGEEFIRVFEEESKKLGDINYLVQGTIYPDVIESGGGSAAVIKSHHNVGGLPENVGFDGIIEPLRDLFKDEVRAAGVQLGLPEAFTRRQPFPGPGLAIRVIGEITEEKLAILREADAIFRREVEAALPGRAPSQYFAVLTDSRSVGVIGDARNYGYILALRAVTTDDFMTADWTRLPLDLLERVSNQITNEIHAISRVVYDITSKPPATVEWE